MLFLADDDPRAYFTIIAACGASQICITADKNGFRNADHVYKLSDYLFSRWRYANVDNRPQTQQWTDALTKCDRQRRSFWAFSGQMNCALAMMVPHDGADLTDALTELTCGDPADRTQIASVIERCFLMPEESLGGGLLLRRALRKTYATVCH